MSTVRPTAGHPNPGHLAPGDPVPAARPARPVDVTVTITLIVLLGLGGLLSLALGLYFMMAAAGCSEPSCIDRVAVGVLLIELAPIVAWAPTSVWAVVRMVRRKVAFWVPLLALPVYLVVVVVGLSVLPG